MRNSITAGFLGWMICTVAVGQDINLDGVLDCADTELLGDAIVNGDMDSRFDLDGNGIVELATTRFGRMRSTLTATHLVTKTLTSTT